MLIQEIQDLIDNAVFQAIIAERKKIGEWLRKEKAKAFKPQSDNYWARLIPDKIIKTLEQGKALEEA